MFFLFMFFLLGTTVSFFVRFSCVLGSDMYPETFVEVLFTNCITLLGVATFAVVIGSASSLVANMDQGSGLNQHNQFEV